MQRRKGQSVHDQKGDKCWIWQRNRDSLAVHKCKTTETTIEDSSCQEMTISYHLLTYFRGPRDQITCSSELMIEVCVRMRACMCVLHGVYVCACVCMSVRVCVYLLFNTVCGYL